MKPSRGLKTPVEIICTSDRARGPRGIFANSSASLRRPCCSSPETLRSTSCPPWGAMNPSFVIITVYLLLPLSLLCSLVICVLVNASDLGYPRSTGYGFGGKLVVVG